MMPKTRTKSEILGDNLPVPPVETLEQRYMALMLEVVVDLRDCIAGLEDTVGEQLHRDIMKG